MHSTLLSIRKAGRVLFTLCSIMSELTNTPLTLDQGPGSSNTARQIRRPWSAGCCSTGSFSVLVFLRCHCQPSRCHPTSYPPSLPVPSYDTAIQVWSQGHDNDSLVGASAEKERNWDNIKAIKVAESLLNEASDDIERARLLAARTRPPELGCMLFLFHH